MKTAPYLHTRQGRAALATIALALAAPTVLAVAPASWRPMATATAITALVLSLLCVRHYRRHRAPPKTAREPWFPPDALDGFPMEAVRPLLLGPHAPDLNRLYTAWILATDGYDSAWISRHLDLPSNAVRILVHTARQRP